MGEGLGGAQGYLALVTVGTRGDVQPFLAIGAGLIAAGYRVLFMTHELFQRVVVEAGFEFVGLKGNPAKTLASPAFREALYHGTHRQQVELFTEAMEEHYETNFRTLYSTIKERHIEGIVYAHTVLLECTSIGQKLGIPTFCASTIPLLPSSELPPVTFTPAPVSVNFMNSLIHSMARSIQWGILGPPINRMRTELLKIPPMKELEVAGLSQACLYSPHVQPKPEDWGGEVEVTGYCVLPMGDYTPPVELDHFLHSGSPPVYMGFGSMPLRDLGESVVMFRDVLRKLRMRGIFCSGWGEIPEEVQHSCRPDVLVIHGAPHEWLFPRCSIAIHHGGAGTTAASLRAGIPTGIFPVQADQPFWAHRVAQLRVGPEKWYSIKELSPLTLETQIVVCSDVALKTRCQEFAASIRSEDGVAGFIEWFRPRFAIQKNRSGTSLNWIPDEQAAACTNCNLPFTFFLRRSHCRSCGRIFCKHCLRKVSLPSWGPLQLCCFSCIQSRHLIIGRDSSLFSRFSTPEPLPPAFSYQTDSQSLELH